MNTGITPSYLLALFINSFPALWVAITIGLTAAISKLINKINEKKRIKLIADKSIVQDNEILIAENKELKKENKENKKAIEEKNSQITRLELIMIEAAATMKGGIEICKQ